MENTKKTTTPTPKQKPNHFKGKNDLTVKKKLAKAFLLGMTDEDACYFADINLYELRDYERQNSIVAERKAKLLEGYQLMNKDADKWVEELIKEGNQKFKLYEIDAHSKENLLHRHSKRVEDFGLETTKQDEQNAMNELRQIEPEVMETMNLETKELMLKAIPYGTGKKSFALELAKNLESDFDAKTATEKSLIQMAVLAFSSYLHVNYEVMQSCFMRDYPDQQRAYTGYLMAVSKEKNNALRQYTTIIQTLKSLKASPIKFNIVTQNLNMGQNQQITNPAIS